MSTYENNRGLAGKVITWILVGIVAIVVLKLAAAIAGLVVGLGFFLLFTVGPILLLGWLVLKALRHLTREPSDVTI